MDAAKPDWCSLPHFLLQLISERLHTRIDILRFRAVCGDFRASTPFPPKITPLKIPVPVELNPIDGDHLLLTESTVYSIQPLNSTERWLVKAEETSPGKLLVFDLFCRLQVKHYLSNRLPSKSLNLLDYRVNEISKRNGFHLVSGDKDKAMKYSLIEIDGDFKRVVASKCLDKINEDEFAVMAIYKNEIIVWRNGDNSWTEIDFSELDFICASWTDIVYQSENFYVVDRGGFVVIVDSKSLSITEVDDPTTDFETRYKTVFMKSLEDLFVINYLFSFNRFGSVEYYVSDTSCIFKIDVLKRKLVNVNKNALKDRVFFVGKDCSFSITVKEYLECKENCLYFTLGEAMSGLNSEMKKITPDLKYSCLAQQYFIFARQCCFSGILIFSDAPIQFTPRLFG